MKSKFTRKRRYDGIILMLGAILWLTGCGGGGSSSGGGGVPLVHYAYTDLGALGPAGTMPTRINDSGQITGSYSTGTNGAQHAFRHSGPGPITAADDLGPFPGAVNGRSSRGLGINSAGAVVG